jgi:amidase
MTVAGRNVDATDLAAAIRGGETTAFAAMEAALARAASRQDLGAVRLADAGIGLSAARSFDDLLARRSRRATEAAFGGVPFLMKDLGSAAKGIACVAGSSAIAARTHPNREDDGLVRRFRRLGLIPFGTSTVPEFGLSLTSEPPGGPVARNPFDATLSPGGSSGGAAAAVAAGIVAIAHATDAAGSIRVPAAACGLFGLKPTRGATPMGPLFGNHLMGIAAELVVARSARDVATALAVCAGDAAGPVPDPDLDGLAPDAGPLGGGVVADAPGLARVDTAGRAAVDAVAAILSDAGHRVETLDPAPLVDLARRSAGAARRILAASLAAWLDVFSIADDEVSPLAAAVRREGRSMAATELFVADLDGARIAHALWRLFEHHDVVVTPMLANGPPTVGSIPVDHDDTERHWSTMTGASPFAALANVGGIPAMAAPVDVGSPVPGSVQLLAPMGADRLLIALAERIAAARPVVLPWGIAGLAGRGEGR